MLPKRIVAIGASDFFGIGDPEEGGFIGRFKTWHETQNKDHVVYNLGIRGETTTQMLKRLTSESVPRKPDLLILTAGSNDIRRIGSKNAPVKTPINKFRENIREMIHQGTKMADVIFISTHPFDESKTAPFLYWNPKNYYLRADIIHYEREVKSICKEEQIPYLDIFNQWIDRDYSLFLHEDGQHANAMGHIMIAEELKKFLKNLYSK